MFGSNCVHEDVVIGVSVGVGGTILIALIVIIITMVVRQRNDKYKQAEASSL
jgi:hypothetical protein